MHAFNHSFNELRKQALDRRNKIICKANADYAETLVQIAALEQRIIGQQDISEKSTISCVMAIMPRDRTFTTLDIQTALEAADPGRLWRLRAVDQAFGRLRQKGLIVRLERARNKRRAVYAVPELVVDRKPLAGLEFPDAIEAVLKESQKPLRTTEIGVRLLELSYDTSMRGVSLRSHILKKLGENERFERVTGGKWVLTQLPGY